MLVFGWIVWGITCILLLTFLLAAITQRDRGLRNHHLRFCGLLFVGILVTSITHIYKLHLLWWVPLTFILNQFILMPLIYFFHIRRGLKIWKQRHD